MHSSARCLLALALLAGCGGSTPAPDVSSVRHDGDATRGTDVPRYDAKTFYETTSVAGASFNHDETRVLVSMDTTGVFNAYALSTDPAAKGKATQLTHSTTESIFAVSYFPHDDRFLYTSDKGGDEEDHLYVRELDGKARDLTPSDNTKASFMGWTLDRTAFRVMTNERTKKTFDIYEYAAEGYSRTLVFKNDGDWVPGPISDNGRWFALSKVVNNADSDIYLWDAAAPKAAPRLVTKHEGFVQHRPATFTRDNAKLVYLTDAHGEFTEAWTLDLASGKTELLHKADWDVSQVGYSRTGKYMVRVTNEDARTVVKVLDTKTGQDVKLPDLPEGDISGGGFSHSESKAAFYISRDRASRDLYVVDLATQKLTRLTNTMNPGIDPDNLVDGRVVRYPSFDGLDIPSVLYRPKSATADAKVPALVLVHGGPGGQSRLGYSPIVQHLVNHGYAVLAVNNRGSSGYGKTFFHMDDRKHGDVDLKDCIWGRKYLESLDWVDGGKIGIMGGSYGGYMVVAALAFEPEAFEVGIDIFGVTNWVRTLESIPPWWASFAAALYAELGDPKTDGERLRKISPLFHASNIVRPLLVVQGANDPRVLKVESDEIVAAAKKNGVPVEYVVFEDEGHGFAKRANRIAASEAFLRFLDAHLRTAGEKSTPPTTQTPARPSMTAEQCTASGGTVVGDIGDGAVHRPDYKCANGKAPSGAITAPAGGPIGVEGSVCCPK